MPIVIKNVSNVAFAFSAPLADGTPLVTLTVFRSASMLQ
jgi:hypothetical protein